MYICPQMYTCHVGGARPRLMQHQVCPGGARASVSNAAHACVWRTHVDQLKGAIDARWFCTCLLLTRQAVILSQLLANGSGPAVTRAEAQLPATHCDRDGPVFWSDPVTHNFKLNETGHTRSWWLPMPVLPCPGQLPCLPVQRGWLLRSDHRTGSSNTDVSVVYVPRNSQNSSACDEPHSAGHAWRACSANKQVASCMMPWASGG